MQQTENRLRLRDVRDGQLVVDYLRSQENNSYRQHECASLRLPMMMLSVFTEGSVDIDELDATEKRWVSAEMDSELFPDGVVA